MRAKLTVGVFVALLIIVAVAIFFKPTCACENVAVVGREVLRPRIEGVLTAEQAFFSVHQRYAQTLTELSYLSDTTVRLQLAMASDTSLRIGARWEQWPEFSCSLQVRPKTRAAEQLICTR